MAEVEVTFRDNGPLIIRGPVELVDSSGERFEVAEGEALFLCRCGQSGRKPFCDGSHKRCGFASAPRAAEVEARKPERKGLKGEIRQS